MLNKAEFIKILINKKTYSVLNIKSQIIFNFYFYFLNCICVKQ